MSSAFWLSGEELDDEQAQAVQGIPETTSFLLRGPAGSGKTNILLLRAKWLTYRKLTDFKIIVFTSSLRQFIQEGCTQYGVNPESVATQMRFFRDILDENGISYELTKNFEADRSILSGKVMSLIESNRISKGYCNTLLIDEAQDYTDTELLVFRKLANNLVLAADSRQSIYRTTHTPDLPEQLVGGNTVSLRYHYRSGLKLCKAADAILAEKGVYPKIQGECRYPESAKPSSVAAIECNSFEEQIKKIHENIKTQIDLYPNERIGVLFPKNEQVTEFKNYMEINLLPEANTALKVDTIHGSKGWEFRAIHIGGAEKLYRMGASQKRLIYTGILRGKTSVHIYYTGHLPGYLDAALASLEAPRSSPTLTDLFKK